MTSEKPASYTGLFGWVRRLKDWVEGLAEKPYALPALFILAFTESIFFPIPADVLLMALCVSLPRQSFRFALVCTAGSVLGAMGGYGIGYGLWYTAAGEFSSLAQFFFDTIPAFNPENFETVGEAYQTYDAWTVFIAGFTPLPYKVVTITAGIFKIDVLVFLGMSLLSRGLRFGLVGALFFFFGKPIKTFIDKYLEILSILFVILLIGGFLALKYVF